jgi:hypothetical protein
MDLFQNLLNKISAPGSKPTTYTEGWITVPGKGRRWRDTKGNYYMQQPGAAPSFTNRLAGAVTSGWREADKRLGGVLPGGGVPGPLTPAARSAFNTAGNVFQGVRDTAMDVTNLPLPERLFVTSITGGMRDNKPFDRITPEEVAAIKGQNQRKEETIKEMREIAAKTNNLKLSEEAEIRAKSVNVPAYDSGDRNTTLGYGTYGLTRLPSGDYRVFDKWKVDEYTGDTPTFKKDLMEGGNIPQLIYEGARRLGLTKPIDIDITIPKEQWERTQAAPSTFQRGEQLPEYMQGPQYQIGPTGAFFQGRNVGFWGYGKSGPLGRTDPMNPLAGMNVQQIQKITPEQAEEMMKSFPAKKPNQTLVQPPISSGTWQ